MKTLEKIKFNKFPQANVIVDDNKYSFLDGIDMFTDKNARAKETLSKIKMPKNWASK